MKDTGQLSNYNDYLREATGKSGEQIQRASGLWVGWMTLLSPLIRVILISCSFLSAHVYRREQLLLQIHLTVIGCCRLHAALLVLEEIHHPQKSEAVVQYQKY